MPIIKSAKKALRQTRKRTLANKNQKSVLSKEIKKIKQENKIEGLNKLYSLLDKSVKKGIIHKNKAGKIKSGLSKFFARTAKTTSK